MSKTDILPGQSCERCLFSFESQECFSPGFPETPYPIPSTCLYEGVATPSHSLFTPYPGIPLHWGIKLSHEQGPLLPLMPDKAILCYICSWSHGSLHLYSLVGNLVSGSSERSDWLILLFFLWVANPFSPAPNSSTGVSVLSLVLS